MGNLLEGLCTLVNGRASQAVNTLGQEAIVLSQESHPRVFYLQFLTCKITCQKRETLSCLPALQSLGVFILFAFEEFPESETLKLIAS